MQVKLPQRVPKNLRLRCRIAGAFGTPRATALVMSHRHVEMLIGRLATDPGLRRRFQEGPAAFLHELVTQGYEFSIIEFDALAGIDGESIRRFASTLDWRLLKVDHYNNATHFQD